MTNFFRIDVIHPDPNPGDPVPLHMLLADVEWPQPPEAVLRPDTYINPTPTQP